MFIACFSKYIAENREFRTCAGRQRLRMTKRVTSHVLDPVIFSKNSSTQERVVTALRRNNIIIVNLNKKRENVWPERRCYVSSISYRARRGLYAKRHESLRFLEKCGTSSRGILLLRFVLRRDTVRGQASSSSDVATVDN